MKWTPEHPVVPAELVAAVRAEQAEAVERVIEPMVLDLPAPVHVNPNPRSTKREANARLDALRLPIVQAAEYLMVNARDESVQLKAADQLAGYAGMKAGQLDINIAVPNDLSEALVLLERLLNDGDSDA